MQYDNPRIMDGILNNRFSVLVKFVVVGHVVESFERMCKRVRTRARVCVCV